MDLSQQNHPRKLGGDGQDTKKPPVTPLVSVVRGGQVVFALIVLILCAVANNKINDWLGVNAQIDALSLAFFSFAWTAAYFIYLFVIASQMPLYYHIIAQLVLEVLSAVWWLVCFALLASRSNSFTYDGYAYFIDFTELDVGLQCMKAAAAMGAVEFVLFCVTTFLTANHFLTSGSPGPTLQTQQPAGGVNNTPASGPHQLAP